MPPLRTVRVTHYVTPLREGGSLPAIVEADEAIKVERRLKGAYYDGMADLLSVTDRQERIARRELYRRCAGIGETVVDVAERVVYAVVKEN